MKTFVALETPYCWYQIDRKGAVQAQGSAESFDELELPKKTGEIIGVAPGDSVVMRQVTVPSRNRRKVEAAIPYALEETLSEDLDDLHFTLLDWSAGAEGQVAIVTKARLQAWSEAFSSAGILLDAIVPEYLLLPTHPQSRITVAKSQDDKVLVRDGDYSGLALDTDTIEYWFDDLEDKNTAIAVNDSDLARQLIGQGGAFVSEWPIGDHFGDWLSHHNKEIQTANLLQGEFLPAHHQERATGFKVAATLFGIAIVLKLLFDGGEYFYLQKKNQRLDQQIETIFKESFPQVKRIVDPRLQMEQRIQSLLSEGAETGVFDTLLASVAQVAQSAKTEVSEISFRSEVMTVAVVVNNFADLDRLQELFQQQGNIAVELLSSGSRDSRVNGRLQLSLKTT